MLETQNLEQHYSDEVRQLEEFIYQCSGLLMENSLPMLNLASNPRVIHRSSYSIVVSFEDGETTKVVKIFAPKVRTVAHREHCRKRFDQEIRIQGMLSQTSGVVPKIEQVLHSPVDKKTYGFIAEFIPGHSLDKLLNSPNFNRLPTNIAPIVLQLLHFFTHMERHNVLHRDIKPGNIIVADNGYVRVIDFGLARIKTDPCRITQPGISLGTLDYTSPEIFSAGTYDSDGISHDHQCDIYSFGKLISEILNPELDQGWARSNYPQEFINIINKCSNSDPKKRYKSFSKVYLDFYNLIKVQKRQN